MEYAIALATKSSIALVEGLRSQGLSISPKSRFVASDLKAAKEIQLALAEEGIKIEIGPIGQDLGVDFVAGGRRRVSLQSTRMTKLHTGVISTLRVGKITKGAATRRLILTGIKPRIYGFSVLGAAPTTVMSIRTSLVKGLCIRKPAGCATTALAMHGYQAKDPLVTMMVENVTGLVEAVMQENRPTLIHQKAFDAILISMPETHRWSHVKGPMSSAIATLLDHGWVLNSIGSWTDPSGSTWAIY